MNINILQKSREFSSDELYDFMYGDEVNPVSMIADGAVVDVNDYLIVEKPNPRTGEPVTVVYISTLSGTYATNSKIFFEKISTIIDLFGEVGTIKILRKKSANNYKYTTCERIFK